MTARWAVAGGGSTAGTGELLRFALRRDRIMLPVWLYALVGSTGATAASIGKLYPTTASRVSLAQSINSNGSLRALYGPVYDATSNGALTAWRMLPYGGLMLGLLCVLLVVRHTRAEEESGRLELIGAGAVGRGAPLAAGLGTAVIASALVGVLTAAVLGATGQPLGGSLAFGGALFGCGVCFAGVGAVTAQLSGTSRAANGIGGAVLGLAFLLRACGDAAGPTGPGWLLWLSPLGWAERVRPYTDDAWWLVALLVVAGAVQISIGYLLAGRRDLGAGLLPQRPGPAVAEPSLRGAGGLAWRLQRGGLLGWAVGFAVGGSMLGGITEGVKQLISTSSNVEQIMERMGGTSGMVDAYLATAMNLLAMVAAVYAVQTALRLRGEETSGRAEPVLATGVSRLGWAASHLLYPLLGSAVLLLVGGITAGLGTGVVLGDAAGWTGKLLVAALVQLPAVWIFAAVTVALFGLLPQWSTAAWGVLGVLLFIAYLGPAVNAGQWLLDLSPFTHVPKLPGSAFQAQPLLWMVLLSVVLAGSGLAGWRRRDVG
ncbi:ABC transporter permease [Streptacidiphilus fuscans]|uniref:ABC transporter permease n=1 Tax=Streptacidiphilus fuscans TaxID=2789292 RepID=A0A931B4E1_9ACTN|nr:ABC transporter permease [Streptacidiphilus fuscans]MBF9068487.1 ABC transporter permease [Streptacidiphilus fuscans]